jgi:hypothetical protein
MSPSNVPLQLPRLEAATIEPVDTESIPLDAGLLNLTIYILCLRKENWQWEEQTGASLYHSVLESGLGKGQ